MPVPWAQIIRWVPPIVEVSRDLLQRSRRTTLPSSGHVSAPEGADPATRIAALEENERRQAELVHQMAEQIAELSRAVVALHRQTRWLILTVVVAVAAACAGGITAALVLIFG